MSFYFKYFLVYTQVVLYLTAFFVADFERHSRLEDTANFGNYDAFSLLDYKPEGTRVFRSRTDERFGTTELTFMNGAQILLKPTDFEDDELILFSGISPGGSSLYLDEDYMSAMMAATIVNLSGLGDFDVSTLQEKLIENENSATLSAYIGEIYEGMTGSVHLSDLETLLQLNYLYFKAPRHDSEAFNSFISQLSKHCDSVRNKPASIYNDSIQRLISGNNPRFVGVPTQAQINRIRHDHTMQIFRDRFADASDFKFVMVGKFDVRAVTPLLETYIGGLPSRQRKETWRDVTTRFPNGISVINISEIDGKRSQGSISMGGDFRWSLKEILVFDIFKEILETNVKAALEKEQIDLDYLSVSGMLYRYPHSQYSLNFVWQSSAKDVNNIAITLFEEAQKMKAQATELALLDYIKENQINTHKEQIETNDYWHTVLLNIYQQGDRPQSHEDYVKLVNSIRPSDIRRAARTYFTETKYIMGRLISAE